MQDNQENYVFEDKQGFLNRTAVHSHNIYTSTVALSIASLIVKIDTLCC